MIRRPPGERVRWQHREPGLLGSGTAITPANATAVRSVVRINAVVEDFLTDKRKGQRGESGNYRRDAGRELGRFVEFLADHEDAVETFEELDSGHLREYARHLARQGWTTGTVRTYYAYVSAFCGWAVREGHLAENVAQHRDATEPIPDDEGRTSGRPAGVVRRRPSAAHEVRRRAGQRRDRRGRRESRGCDQGLPRPRAGVPPLVLRSPGRGDPP